jgi:hypothetical protein
MRNTSAAEIGESNEQRIIEQRIFPSSNALLRGAAIQEVFHA